jgi:Cu-Zn family superoxide dismutase
METGNLVTIRLGKHVDRQTKRWIATLLLMSLSMTASLGRAEERHYVHRVANSALRNTAGERIGSVLFVQKASDTVLVRVRVNGLSPGIHGFHIHAIGQCEPPDFTSAGEHFNPTAENHPNHAGDLAALFVNGDGTASTIFKTDRFTIDQLFDADGAAVIVHAYPDNYAHIPERYTSTLSGAPGPDAATLADGDSGTRVACGVLSPLF